MNTTYLSRKNLWFILLILAVFSFQIPAFAQETPTVTNLILVNADSDTDIQIIPEGAVLDLALLPPQLAIRAEVAAPVGSVVFSGTFGDMTETTPPYSLVGDNAGDFNPLNITLGSHQVSATAYTEAGGAGTAGPTLTVNFTFVDNTVPDISVTNFVLVDADTDSDIMLLTEGAVLDLDTLPAGLNIRADFSGPVSSIVFNGTLGSIIENTVPYSVGGDTNGDYAPINIPVGAHQVNATAYSEVNGSGFASDTVTINFTAVSTPPSNQVPVASANGPYSVDEGNSVALNGSGSDADGDALTFAWDLDNDGTFETAGMNASFAAPDVDGTTEQTVVFQACDSESCDTDTTIITINDLDDDDNCERRRRHHRHDCDDDDDNCDRNGRRRGHHHNNCDDDDDNCERNGRRRGHHHNNCDDDDDNCDRNGRRRDHHNNNCDRDDDRNDRGRDRNDRDRDDRGRDRNDRNDRNGNRNGHRGRH